MSLRRDFDSQVWEAAFLGKLAFFFNIRFEIGIRNFIDVWKNLNQM